ncbi:MAG: hypothetical protein K5854_01510 [Prevotella sp.]|nr:hypothetical protein [Prevotella sp.]
MIEALKSSMEDGATITYIWKGVYLTLVLDSKKLRNFQDIVKDKTK